jgi:hypothetical protein
MNLVGKAEPTRVIVKSDMRLDLARETHLCNRVLERFELARKEMGWRGPKSGYCGLLGKWKRYTDEYLNDFSARALEDELFETVNSSDNVPQRAIRAFKARANEKLLSTEPWCSVGQQRRGKEDPRIKLVDEYFEELLEEAEVRRTLHRAIEGAGVRGVQILKIAQRLDQVYARKDVQIVMMGGQPMLDSAGRPVTAEDKWEDDPETPGQSRLQRDPRIKHPLDTPPEISEDKHNLPTEQPTRKGLSVANKPWQDFFCSPTARSIHEADCFDVYDLDVDDLLSRMYSSGGQLSDEAEQWLEKVRREDGMAKSDSGLPNEDRGEIEEAKDARPKIQVAECWLKIDADGDNRAEEMHFVMDITNQQPIFYTYMQEASPTGRRPYVELPMIPVEGRWHGMGYYELLKNQHSFIDRQRNRIDARSGITGHILLQRAGAIRDTKWGVPLGFNNRNFYTVEDSVELKEAIGAFSLPPVSEECRQLMTDDRQIAQMISGNLSPRDEDFSDSPGAETLGALELMAKESEILNDDALQGLITGIREALDQAAQVTLTPDNFDLAKCRDVLDETDAQQVESWVMEDQARNLSRRIKLLLTKSRSLEQLQSNKQAVDILAIWDSYTAEQQVRYFDIFVEILNSLEIDAPDKRLGDPEARLAAEQEMAAAGLDPLTGQPIAQPTDPTAPQNPNANASPSPANRSAGVSGPGPISAPPARNGAPSGGLPKAA